MKFRVVMIIVAVGCLFLAPIAFAHHGLARFDTTHIVTMKGTITRFGGINPHAYVYADIPDSHGKTANWMLECGSLACSADLAGPQIP